MESIMFVEDLRIILIAATPLLELQFALPIALSQGFSIPRALLDAYMGNFLPILPLLYGLQAALAWSDRHVKFVHRFLQVLFERTHRRFSKNYQHYGALALFLFMAIPTPLSGVWSACVAAVVLGIKPRHALPAIFGGSLLSGLIMVGVTRGVFAIF